MRKLLAILLTCVITMGVIVIPASADSIYYPCYEGKWYIKEITGTPVKLEIYDVTDSDMGIYFQYGQFAVSIDNAKIDGMAVNGSYHEAWDGGYFIVDGTITLTLYDTGIWVDWHSYENGKDNGITSYMFYNDDFLYKTIKEIEPLENYIDKVKIEEITVDNKVRYTVTSLNGISLKGITLFAAEYDKGKLSKLKTGKNELSDGVLNITFDIPSDNHAKIMLWDKNQIPIISASKSSDTELGNEENEAKKAAKLVEQEIIKKHIGSAYSYDDFKYKYYVIDYKSKYLVCAHICALANGEYRYWVDKFNNNLTYIGNGSDWYIENGTVYWFEGSTVAPDGSQRADNNIYEF